MSMEWLTDIFSKSVLGTLSRFGWVGDFVEPGGSVGGLWWYSATLFRSVSLWLSVELTSDVFVVREVE